MTDESGEHFNPGFGYKGSDEPDARDYAFATTLAALDPRPTPADATLQHYVHDILQQGRLSTCVLNAFAQGIRVCEIRNLVREGVWIASTPAPELTSRLFGFYNSRAQHGDVLNDSGTYIRLAIKAANRLGRPPESEWPYDLRDTGEERPVWTQQPDLQAYQFAADHKPAKYSRIFEEHGARIDAIKRSIAFDEAPIIFGTAIPQSFLEVRSGDLIPRPGTDERSIGGHALLIIGYDATGVWVANSWGTRWGELGFGHMAWDYITWASTRDLWQIDL